MNHYAKLLVVWLVSGTVFFWPVHTAVAELLR